MVDEKIKILAYYLPQFHEIPENNRWWGKGFTEWVNVRKAVPLFEGHQQPKVPYNQNYYDLSDVDVMRWQTNIAKENGIYGFCFYHYWFSEKPLLEKPLLNYLKESSIDFPYCLCWANESWTNGWAKSECSVIMEQRYGEKEEWKKHFDFLLPFFKDSRYIKEENAPLLVIYRPYLYEKMLEMLEYWKELALESGFSGLKIASQRFEDPKSYSELFEYLDYHILYEPGTSKTVSVNPSITQRMRQKLHDVILDKLNLDISVRQSLTGPVVYDYDERWKEILQRVGNDPKEIAGAFVNWDNTPRHARRGSVYKNVSATKFGYYMQKQIENVRNNYNNNYLFLFAWNEWGEGGILEPDEENGYSYLYALKEAVINSKNDFEC